MIIAVAFVYIPLALYLVVQSGRIIYYNLKEIIEGD